ncbi:MAG TPA: DUF2147 domain-containing protein [Rudaea sp.]|jgi:uncharacterized protein (DUF2147 family)
MTGSGISSRSPSNTVRRRGMLLAAPATVAAQQPVRLPIFARVVFAALIAVLDSTSATSQEATPVGTWTTIDDQSHRPRSEIEITETGGVLSGRIVRLFTAPREDANPRCADCPGDRHSAPVLGMTILWNLHRHGDDWDGGEILDPESGKIYRVTLHTGAAGDRLEVRGYIGFSLLGRTQVWERVPAR